MPSKLSRSLAVRVLAGMLFGSFGSTLGAQAQATPWPLIRVPDPQARHATIAALDAAAARLTAPDCGKILTDFNDPDGQSLSARLSAVGVQIQEYLTMIT